MTTKTTRTAGGRVGPQNALGVIALFVGVVELAFAYPVTVLTSTERLLVLCFMVTFPVLVLFGFFTVLIRYPEKFYSPRDFDDPNAFIRLAERRDRAVDAHLERRTAALESLAEDARKAAELSRAASESVHHHLNNMPLMNPDALRAEIGATSALVAQASKLCNGVIQSEMLNYILRSTMQSEKVWIDSKTLKGPWSLDFLITAAVKAFEASSSVPHGSLCSFSVQDGDVARVFACSKSVRPEAGITLTIAYERAYATTG